MQENRQHERFEPAIPIPGFYELNGEVLGEFRNREAFRVRNISLGGFNLVSNHAPAIGEPCPIVVHYGEASHEFDVRIVHSRILRFQAAAEGILRAGIVYATGCEILHGNEGQEALIQQIIRDDCRPPLEASAAERADGRV